jgi:hypothetical protein
MLLWGGKQMSIKKLLGLDNFPIKEHELIERISSARRNHTDFISLTLPSGKSIRFRVSAMHPEGIMQGNFRQYKNGW